ncbi:MAG: hypothetical protein ACYS74_16350 [Planctomycetota bacterium]|jgi:hypothetical protein
MNEIVEQGTENDAVNGGPTPRYLEPRPLGRTDQNDLAPNLAQEPGGLYPSMGCNEHIIPTDDIRKRV